MTISSEAFGHAGIRLSIDPNFFTRNMATSSCNSSLLQGSCLEINSTRKESVPPAVFHDMFLEIFEWYPDYRRVYTDGSIDCKQGQLGFTCVLVG